MVLLVTSDVIATLVAEAARAAPEECCGLLLGREGRIEGAIPAANVAADRQRHFEIDPAALFAAHRAARAGGPELIGYFHSHPSGHPVPSATDCEHASGDDRAWAIVAEGTVAFWRDGAEGFEPLSHCVLGG
ncbi:MAG: M67 family peptidase [Novosphingobium sp.]|nr:MAG: M67 family peptidase [Novosphingobium sp.]